MAGVKAAVAADMEENLDFHEDAKILIFPETKGTYVAGQAAMTERIRNERRVEFPNEGINYFDELRWKTWKNTMFSAGNGVQQVWGQNTVPYTWGGDYLCAWPVPAAEIERNTSLEQNPGWPK